MVVAAKSPSASLAVVELKLDCERDELLMVLNFLYLDELPAIKDDAVLIRLRALAQDFLIPALDNFASAVLASRLTPSLCCELIREVAREEARARLASAGGAILSPTCATLKEACANHASRAGLGKLGPTEAFQKLPNAQKAWLFAKCHEGYALHALVEHSAAEGALYSLEPDGLLQSLLAPPHELELDGLARAAPPGAAGAAFGGKTPLHVALSTGNWAVATMLLDAGASPHPPNLPKGRTLLHLLAEAGDAQACAYLAQRGAAISAPDHDSMSPFDVAVMAVQPAAANKIREFGGMSTYGKEGDSLIHDVARTGQPTPLALLASPEIVDLPNAAGLTPLQLATAYGRRTAAEVLLGARADINRVASQLQQIRAAEHADRIAQQAQPPQHSADMQIGGAPPLFIACRQGDASLVELLLEHGAKVDDKHDGATPLHLGATFPACARLLLSAAASVDERDNAGCTPLHHAVSAAAAPPVRLPGALVRPPAQLADASVQVLLEAGARPNTAEYLHKQTPLHKLCKRGGGGEALEALLSLVSAGATINAQDKHGFTPLHMASFLGHTDLALGLVAAGASLNVPCNDGVCAISARSPAALQEGKPPSRVNRAAMLARIAQPLPWLPDNMSESCQLCEQSFTNANRRHHCRHCGRIVCSSCSSHKAAIPKFGIHKGVRVCSECEPVLKQHPKPLGPPQRDSHQTRDVSAEATVEAAMDSLVAAKMAGQPLPPPAMPPPDEMPCTATDGGSNPFGSGDQAGTPAAVSPLPTSPIGLANPFGEAEPVSPPRLQSSGSNPFDSVSLPADAAPVPNLANPFGEPGDAPTPPVREPSNPFASASGDVEPGRESLSNMLANVGDPFADD